MSSGLQNPAPGKDLPSLQVEPSKSDLYQAVSISYVARQPSLRQSH